MFGKRNKTSSWHLTSGVKSMPSFLSDHCSEKSCSQKCVSQQSSLCPDKLHEDPAFLHLLLARNDQQNSLPRFSQNSLPRFSLPQLLPFCRVFSICLCAISDQIACSDPDVCNDICENKSGCTNIAYPLLVLNLLPSGTTPPKLHSHFRWFLSSADVSVCSCPALQRHNTTVFAGLRGLMLAAMFAALMSSLTSQYNGTSSMFTMDIWKHIRPQASLAMNELHWLRIANHAWK